MLGAYHVGGAPAAVLLAAALTTLCTGCGGMPNCIVETFSDAELAVNPAVTVYVTIPRSSDSLADSLCQRLTQLMSGRGIKIVDSPAEAECLMEFEIRHIDSVPPPDSPLLSREDREMAPCFPDGVAFIQLSVFDRNDYFDGDWPRSAGRDRSPSGRILTVVRIRWRGTLFTAPDLLENCPDYLLLELLGRYGRSDRWKRHIRPADQGNSVRTTGSP